MLDAKDALVALYPSERQSQPNLKGRNSPLKTADGKMMRHMHTTSQTKKKTRTVKVNADEGPGEKRKIFEIGVSASLR